MKERSNRDLDRVLRCDCQTKINCVCDMCQIIKPAIKKYRFEIKRLKQALAAVKEADKSAKGGE